jgi:hypothetical protein
MIFYLYTGNIRFNPFVPSEKPTMLDGDRKSKNLSERKTTCIGLEPVSSKSIFRLADKVNFYQKSAAVVSQLSLVGHHRPRKPFTPAYQESTQHQQYLARIVVAIHISVSEATSLFEFEDLSISRHPKVREMELNFLIANWDEARVTGQFEFHLGQLAEGKIPHAFSIFSELFKRLKPDSSACSPSSKSNHE